MTKVLKVRVIPTMLHKGFGLVKGEKFDSWRRVGSAMQAVKVYNLRNVDELIFLDISASQENEMLDLDIVDEIADECFVPLTVGGGLASVEQVRAAFSAGADKVSLGTGAVLNPKLITDIATNFGTQAVVVSIDVKTNSDGVSSVMTHSGNESTELDPVEWAIECVRLGAGEILITSIEHDGMMLGYNIKLCQAITNVVSIPVICSGGAGKLSDFSDAVLLGGASAVAAASLFHFTELTPMEAKIHMAEQGIPVRF
jgi:cyclase